MMRDISMSFVSMKGFDLKYTSYYYYRLLFVKFFVLLERF